jgi:hypothetical protein
MAYCALRVVSLALSTAIVAVVSIAISARAYFRYIAKRGQIRDEGYIQCSEDVSGNPINEGVMELLREQTKCGRQRSFQIAAYLNGAKIVDCWGGCEEHDLFMAFSISKGVAAGAVALCADSGLIDYGAKVSSYWPNFAQCGKGHITVQDAISHRSGLKHTDVSPLVRNIFAW